MQKQKVTLSIIIVHYKADKEFFDALASIQKLKTNIAYEVIVVDNDEQKTIDKRVKHEFPWVNYIKAPGDVGFGTGNNIGNKQAKGKYLFFLNPDTKVYPQCLDNLVAFLDQNPKAAIVAPLLFDPNKKVYPLQGHMQLTPLRGAVGLSFLNKLFPNNPISKNYWQPGWDKTKVKEVDVVPGTAFVVRKEIYDQVNGFDENFFLYFEEFDLCKRIRDLGYQAFIIPNAKVMHLWGRSTKETKNINIIFQQSRVYYFKKHFGLINSLFVEAFARFSKKKALFTLILLFSIWVRLYQLNNLMLFFGDIGWFYLSARDMLLTSHIPLVGITSSHPWLHQGALWTYMLALPLFITNFNPLAGGYFTAGVGIITVWLIYKVGTEIFSENTGIIAALLYAASPMAIIYARMPYHTSLIPFFTLLLINYLYKWIKGHSNYFPWIIFCLTILYNLELATALLGIVFFLIVIFGLWKRKTWINNLTNKKIIITSLAAFIIPMLPIFLYDTQHGYPQTIKFPAWIGYKILTIGIPMTKKVTETVNLKDLLTFTFIHYQRLIYLANPLIAAMILTVTMITFYTLVYKTIKNKTYHLGLIITAIIFTIPLAGYFAAKTLSEAYLPMLFPGMILLTAISLNQLTSAKKITKIILVCILIGITSMNTYSLIKTNYLTGPYGYGAPFSDRLKIAKKIIQQAGTKKYNLKGKGPGSQFPSFTNNYTYLTWWLGNPPSQKPEKLQFTVYESPKTITIEKEDK